MSVDSKLAALKKQRDMYTANMKASQQEPPPNSKTPAPAHSAPSAAAAFAAAPRPSSSAALPVARDPMRASRVGAISTNLPMPEAVSQSDVDRITEKVAGRLKQELKEQVLREQEQHLRNQLQSRAMLEACLAQELEAHTCAVCYSLMAPPHTPEMLFPCGHTFCCICVQQRKCDQGSSLRCPQCGARVETTTTNHALLQMVQAILEKRRRIESGDISLTSSHASAPTQASPHRPSTASTGAHGSNAAVLGIIDIAAGSNDADVDKYVGEYRILSVRQRVLENELQDIQVQTAQAEKRMQSGVIVRDHMHKELQGAEERMRLLQQEIALIRTQICAQDDKVADATRSINELQLRRSLVESSLQSVETEAGRARLLLQALAPALEYVCELVGLGYNVTLCSVNSL